LHQTFIIKPSGAKCNLACEYCYLISKETMYQGSQFYMEEALLETFIRQYFESQKLSGMTFSWQGGEQGLNYLCTGYKAFFKHIDHPMRRMAGLLHQRRPPAEIMTMISAGEIHSHHS